MPGEDGKSLRDHLLQVEATTGVRPQELLEAADVPWQGEYVWNWFWELHSGRHHGLNGALPLTWSDIKSWSTLFKIKLDPWELQTLKSMDAKFLEAIREKYGSSNPKHKDRNQGHQGSRTGVKKAPG